MPYNDVHIMIHNKSQDKECDLEYYVSPSSIYSLNMMRFNIIDVITSEAE